MLVNPSWKADVELQKQRRDVQFQGPKFAGWWFGTCFICPYIGNNHPNGLIFFRGVQTTNQDGSRASMQSKKQTGS